MGKKVNLTEIIPIRITKGTRKVLRDQAKREDVTVSQLIRRAIKNELARVNMMLGE